MGMMVFAREKASMKWLNFAQFEAIQAEKGKQFQIWGILATCGFPKQQGKAFGR
jgi:hypothetical protein